MASELAAKSCVPCRGGVPPLKGGEIRVLLEKLEPGWEVVDEHHLEKQYVFEDFKEALGFVNRLGGIAESEGHHPDILLSYGKAKVTIWTHKIDGLTESDFVLAAKGDEAYGG